VKQKLFLGLLIFVVSGLHLLFLVGTVQEEEKEASGSLEKAKAVLKCLLEFSLRK
jgi:hypothetical protein